MSSSRATNWLPLPCVILVTWLFAPSLPAQDVSRAVWIWEADTYRMLDDDVEREQVIRFLRDSGVTIAYLYADEWRDRNALTDQPEKYRRLIARLTSQGLTVYALLGSAHLDTEEYVLPEKREAAEAMLQRVLDYNAGSSPEERFAGVNLDIEPYLLDDWDRRLHERAVQYLELSRRFMEMVDESGQALHVGPAIPFWFDGIEGIEFEGKTQSLSRHTQDLYDYVSLMCYRDFAEGSDGILYHGQAEVAYGNRIGKRVFIGVETDPVAADMDKLSFFEEGRGVMERELSLVIEAWQNRPAFGGLAVHHLSTYRRLSP